MVTISSSATSATWACSPRVNNARPDISSIWGVSGFMVGTSACDSCRCARLSLAQRGSVHSRSALGCLFPGRQLEHPERTTLGDRLGQLGHIAAPQWNRAAVTGGNADVLLTILFPGDRRGNDPGAGLELPQLLAGLGIERLEVAIACAGEHQVARGRQDACPQRQRFLVLPFHLAGGRVHRAQNADMVVIQTLD